MQFMFGVGGYIVARVLAILLPLFFVNQPGQEDLAIRVVLILENIVLWGFLAALAYIFRSDTIFLIFGVTVNEALLDFSPARHGIGTVRGTGDNDTYGSMPSIRIVSGLVEALLSFRQGLRWRL